MTGSASRAELWGCSAEDWHHFSAVMGLTSDLLPVVCNPHARVVRGATFRGIGKTPSQYDKAGAAVSISRWSSLKATPAHIDDWASQPDYGICVQTRRLVAFDINVEDRRRALIIAASIVRSQPNNKAVLVRYLENSGRLLIPFRLNQPAGGRRLAVEGGQVQLLGSGQQFVAVGTHCSGVRYRWATLEYISDRAGR